MAGHSKWANIKHRKAAQDAKRAKIFTKHIREITVAARLGGPDPDTNARLRLALDRAFAVNLPKDRADAAVKKGAGLEEVGNYEELRYEGYGPGGTAIMVDCMTDNRNRTVSEVRHAFSKHSGKLGTDNSVAYLFQERGVLLFPPESDREGILEVALEAGAEDMIENDDGSTEVITSPDSYRQVRDALLAAELHPAEADVTQRPDITVQVEGEDAIKNAKLIDRLEDLDDVQHVYTNADIPEQAYESL
ncbi:YebC/PmpR family DNA-binding transcriptional regulator [Halorhodospira halochloris]|uniref:YebC/PmpR family DNA-binding transcriptional regulator n=1 Tax=Halorhodospira halochloris TaxID=1052 RepID=UPI001EE908AB|nr:YebC/PmpR family DNA-binding transcriptional regulator [Halorhodospira halochloris]MCG5531598.1 YebC/PmpR family DNA-binding transcriptional regulator [Halorhodospira halochloris]MCG5548355.1 YebC/PmpR family DNA-binding transcriptional regulator [Halorhodospira halochloris]